MPIVVPCYENYAPIKEFLTPLLLQDLIAYSEKVNFDYVSDIKDIDDYFHPDLKNIRNKLDFGDQEKFRKDAALVITMVGGAGASEIIDSDDQNPIRRIIFKVYDANGKNLILKVSPIKKQPENMGLFIDKLKCDIVNINTLNSSALRKTHLKTDLRYVAEAYANKILNDIDHRTLVQQNGSLFLEFYGINYVVLNDDNQDVDLKFNGADVSLGPVRRYLKQCKQGGVNCADSKNDYNVLIVFAVETVTPNCHVYADAFSKVLTPHQRKYGAKKMLEILSKLYYDYDFVHGDLHLANYYICNVTGDIKIFDFDLSSVGTVYSKFNFTNYKNDIRMLGAKENYFNQVYGLDRFRDNMGYTKYSSYCKDSGGQLYDTNPVLAKMVKDVLIQIFGATQQVVYNPNSVHFEGLVIGLTYRCLVDQNKMTPAFQHLIHSNLLFKNFCDTIISGIGD